MSTLSIVSVLSYFKISIFTVTKNIFKRKTKHLFEYLAKEGAKTDRVKEYELMKEKLDLKSCTFKPKILKKSSEISNTLQQKSFERLTTSHI